jgi:GT2 family glycosyltransferase
MPTLEKVTTMMGGVLSASRHPVRLLRSTVRVWRKEGFRRVLEEARNVIFRPPEKPLVTPSDYRDWLADHQADADQLAEQRRAWEHFPHQPLLSLITPVFDPPPAYLQEVIESVLAQSYGRWELCLVDGGSRNPAVHEVLKQAAGRDPRILVKFLPKNLGISGNSNEAVRLASGEFVIILDHDDVIEPDWLYEIARQLNLDPSLDVIYCDEDIVSADAKEHFHIWMKPKWAPEFLSAAHFLMHAAFRRSLVLELGGFRPETDGAQDWDLALRVAHKTNRISHVPRVLYHWRSHSTSAAGSSEGKPWAFTVHPRVLRDHLARMGFEAGQAEDLSPGRCRLSWKNPPRTLSVIVTSPDDPSGLSACVRSILKKTRCETFQIVAVGVAGPDWPTAANVEVVPAPDSLGPGAAWNLGAQRATGDVLVFLSAALTPLVDDWLSELALWAARPEIGAVGARQVGADGGTRQAGQIIALTGSGRLFEPLTDRRAEFLIRELDFVRNYLVVSGNCLAVRRSVFDEVGGFDEAYRKCFADADFCLRVTDRGYRNLYTPFAKFLITGEGESAPAPPDDTRRAVQRLLPVLVAGDPYSSPNLSSVAPGLQFLPDNEPSRRELLVNQNRDAGVTEEFLLGATNCLPFTGLLTEHRLNDTRMIDFPARGRNTVLLVLPTLSRSLLGRAFLRLACLYRDRGDNAIVIAGVGGRLADAFDAERIQTIISPLALGAPITMKQFLSRFHLLIAGGATAAPLIDALKGQGGRCLWLLPDTTDQFKEDSSLARIAARADILACVSTPLAKSYRQLTANRDVCVVPGDETAAQSLLRLADGLASPAPST